MYDSNDVAANLTAAPLDSAPSQRQLALLLSTPVSIIVDLELGNLHRITAEQLLSVLHQVGLNMKIQPIHSLRPTYHDLVASNLAMKRVKLFA